MRLDLDTSVHLLRFYLDRVGHRAGGYVPPGTPGARLETRAACGKSFGSAKNHRRGTSTTKLSRVTCAGCKAALVEEKLRRAT